MIAQKITAIVPAFNEEVTVAKVVRVLKSSPWLNDVLVISDGSTDRTAQRAREAGARVHELPRHGGKGEAMLHALTHTDAPIVAFFDADLKGLTKEHVEQLVLPVLHGSHVMNVGLRDRGKFLTAMNRHLPLIAGERALRRSVMEQVPPKFLKGFMVETVLNYFCRSRGLAYGAVELKGLSIRHKYEKVGYLRGVIQYVWMTLRVIYAMIEVRIARWTGNF